MAVHLEAIEAISETKRAESIGQFDLFGGNESQGVISGVFLDIPADEWDKPLLLSYEREMLGLYVSDHPLLGVEHVLKSVRDIPVSQIFDENVGHESIFTIAGLITNVQRKVSRQGANWAIVTVEDLEGAIDVLFFSNSYQQHALNLIEDRIVAIRGRVDKREETPRFTALDLSLPDINQAPIGPFVIRVEAERCTPPLVDRMKEILRSHPGTREVHLRIEGGSKDTTFRLDDGLKVTASPSLSADLKSILGPDCLV
jgi:DNA polymerase-3 subunit alpha